MTELPISLYDKFEIKIVLYYIIFMTCRNRRYNL